MRMSATTGGRIPLAEAETLAREVVELLRPACAKIEIAGSIRRRRPDVGDLEIVAVPCIDQQFDLFGEPASEINRLDELLLIPELRARWCNRLDKNGRTAYGSRYKRLFWCEPDCGWIDDEPIDQEPVIALDLFSVLPPAQFGAIFAIRTGPSGYSQQLVTKRGSLSREGRPGLMPPHLYFDGGALRNLGGRVIATPTEEALYEALGLDWVAPEERK
jgi:DNA polymerase/3'-5' exonuclease PolX